jgi:predicted phosphodiesterase
MMPIISKPINRARAQLEVGAVGRPAPRRPMMVHMRVAIVSDAHGNLVALEAVLRDLRDQSPDLVLHGGDLAVAGPRPAEVVDRIRELGWRGVLGNTDQVPWNGDIEASIREGAPKLRRWLDTLFGRLGPWAAERLGRDRLAWLHALPPRIDQDEIRLVHASPASLWRAPMPDAPGGALGETYGPLGGRVAVYGHIHRPFVAETDRQVVANAGSAGLPWDGDPRAAYLLVDGGVARVRRVPYDVEAARRDAQQAGFPLHDWLGEVYGAGRFSTP